MGSYIVVIEVKAVVFEECIEEDIAFRERDTNFSKIDKRSCNLVEPLFVFETMGSAVMGQ
jgi:hypothetical protein